MNRSNLHVVPRGFYWGVLSEGFSRPSRLFTDKWSAADHALQSAVKRKSCVIAHDRRGAFARVECARV